MFFSLELETVLSYAKSNKMAETRSTWSLKLKWGGRGGGGDAEDGARVRFELRPLDELIFQDEII